MTPILRWKAAERVNLFPSLPLADVTEMCTPQSFPKVGSVKMREFLHRWGQAPRRLSMLLRDKGKYSLTIPKTAGYYIAAYPSAMERNKQMTLTFGDEEDKDLAMVLLNSNTYFWLWRVYGDGFDVTAGTVGLCDDDTVVE